MKKHLVITLSALAYMVSIPAADVGCSHWFNSASLMPESKEVALDVQCSGNDLSLFADGQEIACINKDLLCKRTLLGELDDSLFEVHVKDLFADLGGHRAAALADLLKENGKRAIKKKITKLDAADVTVLFNKAVFWDIKDLRAACAAFLAKNIKDVNLNEIAYPDLLAEISEQVDMAGIAYPALFIRKWDETIEGMAYRNDLAWLLVLTTNRLVHKDLKNGLEATLVTRRKWEDMKNAYFNKHGTQLLVKTDRRVISRNLITGNEWQFVACAGEYLARAECSPAENELLIITNKRVISRDLNSGRERLFSISNNPHESMRGVKYSSDGSQLLIATNKRVVTMNVANRPQRLDELFKSSLNPRYGSIEPDPVQSACYNPDCTRVLIATCMSVVERAVNGSSHLNVLFIPGERECVFDATYSADGKRLQARITRGLLCKDIQSGQEERYYDRDVVRYRNNGCLLVLESNIRMVNVAPAGGSQRNKDRRFICEEDEENYFGTCSYDSTGRVILTKKRILSVDPNNGLHKVLFTAKDAESIIKNVISDQLSALPQFIATNKRVVKFLCSEQELDLLQLKQKQLLHKALSSWQQNSPHVITKFDELNCHAGLPESLHKPELFIVDKQALDKEAKRTAYAPIIKKMLYEVQAGC